jgi:glycine cleavage system H protein
MAYPAHYRYTREHEWIRVDGIVGEVGITDYAQSSLGDIVYVEAPEVGANVEKDKVFGSVESVKAVSDLYSPVSGMVTAVNDALSDAPEQINQDAHEAWIVKVQLSKPSQVDSLMTAKEYEQFISEEGSK